jgi:hypothetical protein
LGRRRRKGFLTPFPPKYQKLHDIFTRLNDDEHVFQIDNVKLPSTEAGLTVLNGPNAQGTDFRSATLELDFSKIKGMDQPTPADKVPGFSKYAGLIGNTLAELIETAGHEGAHGVWALDNPNLAVTLQNLTNMEFSAPQSRHGRQLGFAGAPLVDSTETYAQQQEQILNKQLIVNPPRNRP